MTISKKENFLGRRTTKKKQSAIAEWSKTNTEKTMNYSMKVKDIFSWSYRDTLGII